MAGALSLLMVGCAFIGVIGIGIYKAVAADPPPPIAWCDAGKNACQKECAAHAVTIVYFHASWCPACQRMEATTFADPEVRERMTKYGAIVYDIEVSKAAAERAGLHAIPTFIALRGCDREIMRVTGGMNRDTFLGWLDGLDKIVDAQDAQ